MIDVKKVYFISKVLLSIAAVMECSGAGTTRETSSEEVIGNNLPHYTSPGTMHIATQAAFHLDMAKMALTNTITHYLKTGEWKHLGCPQITSPSQYVACWKVNMVNNETEHTMVLHPNPNLNSTIFSKEKNFMVYSVLQGIFEDANACSCDHNNFWALSTYEWSDSDEVGENFQKTSISTKVFSSENQDSDNYIDYDPCSPSPQDTVFVCAHGVWQEDIKK